MFFLQMVSYPGQCSFCRWCPILVNVLFADGVLSWSMFFLQMVSYPGQCSFCRWCPILVNVLLADGVLSWSMSFLQMVSYPGHGTRIARGMGTIIISMSLCLYLVYPLVPQEILVTAQNCKRMGMVQLLVMSIRFISQFLNLVLQEMSQYQNCKRCPSTSLYELL